MNYSLGPDRLTQAQEQIAGAAAQRVAAMTRQQMGDIEHWAESLRTLADHLAHLDRQASQIASDKPASGEPDTTEEGGP